MRVNLNCPYSDKEEVKRLGAKWDGVKKVWYVIDAPDLLRFSRWLRAYTHESDAPAPAKGKAGKKVKRSKSTQRPVREGEVYATTGTLEYACACTALPWDDCEHTSSTFSLIPTTNCEWA